MKPHIQVLAESIAQFEGFYVTEAQAKQRGIYWPTIPQRLNNPGDLMFAGQLGAKDHAVTGVDGKVRHYAEFETLDAGWQALYKQIRLDASRGLTLWQFIHKYAPAADANNPEEYFVFVAKQLGASSGDLLSAVIADASDSPDGNISSGG